MAYYATSPNTGATLETQAPDAKALLWQRGATVYEQSSDYFADMEGKGQDSIIQTETDTSKGIGQKIEFKVKSGFYAEPHVGEELFEDSTHFEEIQIGSYPMTVDFIRHSTRITQRMEEYMGMRGELNGDLNEMLGAWLGRLKTEQLFMTFRERINDENSLYAGGKTLDTLSSADVLVWDEIVAMGSHMEPLGGKAAKMGKSNVFSQCVTATKTALFSLRVDDDYKQVLREADNRGTDNNLFNGEYTKIDGHVIKPYNPIEHDGEGAITSPLNPKAFLETAIAPATITFDIDAGAITTLDYFKYFPGFRYIFNVNDQLAASTDTHYLLAINPKNAATDPGSIAMFSYTTGNTGNVITIVNRLAASASGAAVTTLGAVDWDTGVWSGRHTETVAAGATLIPCNEKGVAFGSTFMFGRRAAYRGYGKFRNQRSEETHEGNFIRDVFITSVFGQKICEDRKGRMPGVIQLVHALDYPSLNLPTVA